MCASWPRHLSYQKCMQINLCTYRLLSRGGGIWKRPRASETGVVKKGVREIASEARR